MSTTPTVWSSARTLNTIDAGPNGNDQLKPQVVQLRDGYFMALWADNADSEGAPGYDIMGQIYDAEGAPVWEPFHVNTTHANLGEQTFSAALRADGSVVVAYLRGNGDELCFDVIDTYGSPLGGGVIAQSPGDLGGANVTAAPDGSFYVTYWFFDGDDRDLYASYVSSDLTTVSPPIPVLLGEQITHSSVCILANGGAVIVAQEGQGALRQIVYDAAGGVVSGPSYVASTQVGADLDTGPSVIALTGGGYVITWMNTDGSGDRDPVFQRYSAAGVAQGTVVHVADAGAQNNISAVGLMDGGFFVAWYDLGSHQLRGQRYTSDGSTVGGQITLATANPALNAILFAKLTLLQDGRISVAWHDDGAVQGNSDVFQLILDPRETMLDYSLSDAGLDLTTRLEGTTLTATAFDDDVFGQGGNDTIFGGAGHDRITGGAGADRIDGGADDDSLYGGDGADILAGGAGYDSLEGGAGNDTLDGGEGEDEVSYQHAGSGVTVDLRLGGLQNTGGGGVDTLANIENVVGSHHLDTLIGSEGANYLNGLGGDDLLQGLGGEDFLYGDEGADIVEGNGGHDYVHGGDGDDRVRGYEGFDILTGGLGNDIINGGDGVDTAVYDSAATVDLRNLGSQNTGAEGSDTLLSIENLWGSSFNDTLIGNEGANQFIGGGGADTLEGCQGDDILLGESGDDVLRGYENDDVLHGGDGNDLLNGGDGLDTADYGFAAAVTVSLGILAAQNTGGAGSDTLLGIENVSGSVYADVLTGNEAANTLYGVNGDDILRGLGGDDYLIGGVGRDTLEGGVANDRLYGGSGADSLYGGDGADILRGDGSLLLLTDLPDGVLFIRSDGIDDQLYGGAGDDALYGDDGDDRLLGGGGNDAFDGGAGLDAADYSAASGGVTASLTLGSASNDGDGGVDSFWGVENLTGSLFADSLTGSGADNVLIGGAGNDALSGLDGDDRLIGGAGVDILNGGAGIDTVDYSTAAARVNAQLNSNAASNDGDGGTDTFAGIENLTGSAFNDTLIGDGLDNVLRGGTGADTLLGLGGNDILWGGTGAGNTLQGGLGDDTYVLEGNDSVTEFAGEGTDTVDARINTYVLAVNAENLIFGGTGNFAGTGNAAANTLTGGTGADVLRGRGGVDVLNGGLGVDTADYTLAAAGVVARIDLQRATNDGDGATDTYTSIENLIGSNFNDLLIGDGNVNVLRGGLGADTLLGLGGNDVLWGGTGAGNTLQGGLGDDTYVLEGNDSVTEFAGEGTDTVDARINTYVLAVNAENLIFGGTGNFAGTGNAAANTLTGGTGADVLRGRGGVDVLNGGLGVDTADYTLAAAGVVARIDLQRATNDGDGATDTYTSIENLIGSNFNDTLIGDNNANVLMGGVGQDILLGYGGNDVLMGGSGGMNNQLQGGAGDDYYILEAFDTCVEFSGEGIDTIEARVGTYTLGNHVENLLYTGPGSFVGQGNALNNIITGGAQDDFLRGLGGNDTIRGGLGVDEVQLRGVAANYTVTVEGAGYRIVDSVAGRDGSTWVESVETVRFLANNTSITLSYPPVAPGALEPTAKAAGSEDFGGPLVSALMDGFEVQPTADDDFLPLDKVEGPQVLPGVFDDSGLVPERFDLAERIAMWRAQLDGGSHPLIIDGPDGVHFRPGRLSDHDSYGADPWA